MATKKPTYPMVTSVKDWDTQQALREIWNQVHNLGTTQSTHAADIAAAQSTIATLRSQLTAAQQQLVRIGPAQYVDKASPNTSMYFGVNAGNSGVGGTGSNVSPGGGGGTPAPNYANVVQAAWAAVGGLSSSSTSADWFLFIRTAVWNISALQPANEPLVGLLTQAGGDGTYNCGGTVYACFRLCFNNGANIKVLTGSFQPEWVQEADIPIPAWHAPIDPTAAC
jgi:hypothetical protein